MRSPIRCAPFALFLALFACQGQFSSSSDDPTKPGSLSDEDAGTGADATADGDGARGGGDDAEFSGTAVCGDGTVDPGETCDPADTCPTSCDDADSCTTDAMTGSAEACDAACSHGDVTACLAGDGCCPTGCDENNDADCAAVCGNAVIESGELCDGNCPTACDDGEFCTTDAMTGAAENCNAACTNTDITACADDDMCCPGGCDATNDSDCAAICGNTVVEPGEVCDGNCPANCDDANACTADATAGAAGTCDKTCTNAAGITACTGGDGCCPTACDATNDSDCSVDCRNDATWPANWKSFEASVVSELNAVRAVGADCGVYGTYPAAGPLTMNAQLREASRCHSLDMGTNNFFDHTGSNGSNFSQRSNTAGFQGFATGENIAAGYSTPAQAVAGWVASDGHCRNLMNAGASKVGIGYAYTSGSQYGHYWTMVTGN